MNRISLIAFVIALSLVGCSQNKPKPIDRAELESLETSNYNFAVNLYHQLDSSKGNIFFSPYSAFSALSMTLAGAGGNTAEEMKKALSLNLNQDQTNDLFQSLNQKLLTNGNGNGQTLSIANGLCLTGGDVSNQYEKLIRSKYDAEIFTGGVESVNSWVSNKTKGNIPKIINDLSSNSVCVLLNAVYFNGKWDKPFKPSKTIESGVFWSDSVTSVNTPMMNLTADFRLLYKSSLRILELPYKGTKVSMLIILPKKENGLIELERSLTSRLFENILKEINQEDRKKIAVSLPRFKIGSSFDLLPACQLLGMNDPFIAGKANFTGMGHPLGDLWIAQIKHKAVIEVNETGAEAAAATAVEFKTKSLKEDGPISFNVDHPFLFLIRDNQTGTILFMGRVVDPRGK